MACCSKLNCSEVCECIFIRSTDNSLIINQDGCIWDLGVDYGNIPFPEITNLVTFNPTTRVLCSTVSGVQSCVTIPNDDEYLELDGPILSIFASNGTLLDSVDLSPLLVETPFSATSSSLVITPGGIAGHSPDIEIVPSADANNIFILGSDGRPYVPSTPAPPAETPITPVDTNSIDITATGVSNHTISADLRLDPTSTVDVSITPDGLKVDNNFDVIIEPILGLSFTKTVVGNTVTFTPVFDYVYIASQVCPLCEDPPIPCNAPSVTFQNITDGSVEITVSPLAMGDTYDISIDGGVSWIESGLTSSPTTIGELIENTNYSIVVRLHCATGGVVDTAPQNLLTEDCGAITNLTITSFVPVGPLQNSATATLTWTSGINTTGEIVNFKQSTSPTYLVGPLPGVGTATVTSLLINTLYDFRIQTFCHYTNEAVSNEVQGIGLRCPFEDFNANATGQTTIFYSFNNYSGTSISNVKVDLLNSSETLILQTQNKVPPNNSGTFSGLTPGTNYKIRVTLQAQGSTQLFQLVCPNTLSVTTNAPPVQIFARLEYEGASGESCTGNGVSNFIRVNAYWRTYSNVGATIPYNLPGGSDVEIGYDRNRFIATCSCITGINITTDDTQIYNLNLNTGTNQTIVPNAHKFSGQDWRICNNFGTACNPGDPGELQCSNNSSTNEHLLNDGSFVSLGTTPVTILTPIVI